MGASQMFGKGIARGDAIWAGSRAGCDGLRFDTPKCLNTLSIQEKIDALG